MIVAAVPVKRLADAKSRLSPRLDAQERASLARVLLLRTVVALRESETVVQIAVVSPEKELAETIGTVPLSDDGTLNGALGHAVDWALRVRALQLLILPADLPNIRAEDVRLLLQSQRVGPSIDIASTQDGGTGALLLTPPDAIPPLFGPGSYRRHLDLAHLRSVDVHRVELASFTFDLDTPEDLDTLGVSIEELLDPQHAL